jgi:hypothetical protein
MGGGGTGVRGGRSSHECRRARVRHRAPPRVGDDRRSHRNRGARGVAARSNGLRLQAFGGYARAGRGVGPIPPFAGGPREGEDDHPRNRPLAARASTRRTERRVGLHQPAGYVRRLADRLGRPQGTSTQECRGVAEARQLHPGGSGWLGRRRPRAHRARPVQSRCPGLLRPPSVRCEVPGSSAGQGSGWTRGSPVVGWRSAGSKDAAA